MWELKTGGRLHFGLMELCDGAPHRYAGLGVMLQQPSLLLRASRRIQTPSVSLLANLDQTSRQEYQQRLQHLLSKQPAVGHVALTDAYPFHCGLGCGTQLACAFTSACMLLSLDSTDAVEQWLPVSQLLQPIEADELAGRSGRGLRSAIGLHGFLNGGLVLDHGYVSGQEAPRSVMAQHCSLPQGWTFVLIRGIDNSTITGGLESEMIRKVASSINPHQVKMMDLAGAVLTAATGNDFGAFCDHLEEYMELASRLFAPAQGGRFNGAVCAQSAAVAQEMGLRAVGQSSWGPTVFGIAPTSEQADYIAAKISQRMQEWKVIAAAPANSGAIARYVPATVD